MNTTIRNLVIAAPLATAALMMVPGAATATEPGPVVIVMPTPDPQPVPDDKAPAPKPQQPKPQQPKGPGNIADAPKPDGPKGPGNISDAPKPDGPKGPGNISDAPKPQGPQGPGDLTNPDPCPTHGVDCTPGDEPGTDGGDKSDKADKDPAPADVPTGADRAVDAGSIAVPTRVDAGLAPASDGGMDLSWLLVGGAVVSASGAAFAARKWARSA